MEPVIPDWPELSPGPYLRLVRNLTRPPLRTITQRASDSAVALARDGDFPRRGKSPCLASWRAGRTTQAIRDRMKKLLEEAIDKREELEDEEEDDDVGDA